ncbi:MAG: hypothetical protein CMB64_01055 [Euryarchaeota archaeon]|nr:hypothetical protein [Euryarchaeota archaeon]|tara:strand:- start:1655 stop:3025 length:1371 start_codon:yes stop_codon:yes gene_type:complete
MAESWEAPIDSGPLPKSDTRFDVIVVGGGPGGSAAASYAAIAGNKVLLVEKKQFPRDKVCGDAVGGKSLRIVTELGVKELIESTPHNRVTGITFSSPGGQNINCSLPLEEIKNKEAGYALPRLQFDYMMFKKATEYVLSSGGFVIQNFNVDEVLFENQNVKRIKGISGSIGRKKNSEKLTFHAPLIIGAGGFNCPIANTITKECYNEPMRDEEHYCAAYREYWTDVEGIETSQEPIEIHFIDGVLPGYWWIFPVGKNSEGKVIVNVGIGMVVSELNKRSVNLKKLQHSIIDSHEYFSKKFKGATMVKGSGKGYQLPFGSPRKRPPSYQPRRSAMSGAMCVGDAAALVDPFSGEGIGNALLSAKIAISYFDKFKHKEGFPSDLSEEYMKEIWETLGPELSTSFKLQKMVRKKWLMNWVIRKANKKPELKDLLEQSLSSKEAQEELKSTWKLLRLLLF